jgi:hypothetical protein
MLNGRACDDQTIELFMLHFFEGTIKRVQVLAGRILRLMTPHSQQADVRLQRRVAQQPQQLRFRGLLDGHEVQDCDLERPDVLVESPILFHHENLLSLQYLFRWKIVRYFDWHRYLTLLSLGTVLNFIIPLALKSTQFCIFSNNGVQPTHFVNVNSQQVETTTETSERQMILISIELCYESMANSETKKVLGHLQEPFVYLVSEAKYSSIPAATSAANVCCNAGSFIFFRSDEFERNPISTNVAGTVFFRNT